MFVRVRFVLLCLFEVSNAEGSLILIKWYGLCIKLEASGVNLRRGDDRDWSD